MSYVRLRLGPGRNEIFAKTFKAEYELRFNVVVVVVVVVDDVVVVVVGPLNVVSTFFGD